MATATFGKSSVVIVVVFVFLTATYVVQLPEPSAGSTAPVHETTSSRSHIADADANNHQTVGPLLYSIEPPKPMTSLELHAARQLYLKWKSTTSESDGVPLGDLVSPIAIDAARHLSPHEEDNVALTSRVLLIGSKVLSKNCQGSQLLRHPEDASVLAGVLEQLVVSGSLRPGDTIVLLQVCVRGAAVVGEQDASQIPTVVLSRLQGVVQVVWYRSYGSALTVRTGQAIIAAAAQAMSHILVSHPALRTSTVAFADVDEVAFCGDVFARFRGAEALQLITMRTETPTRLGRLKFFYERTILRALHEKALPLELVGQPIVSHRFFGCSSTAMFAAFLKRVAITIATRSRPGESVVPALLWTVVMEFRARVYSIPDAAVDMNTTTCSLASVGSSRRLALCQNVLSLFADNSSPAATASPPVLLLELLDCYPRRHRGTAAAAHAKVVGVPFRCDERVVAGDAILVNTSLSSKHIHAVQQIQDAGLRKLLQHAGGHYHDASALASDAAVPVQCGDALRFPDAILAYAAGFTDESRVKPLLNSFLKHHPLGCAKLILMIYAKDVDTWRTSHQDVLIVPIDPIRTSGRPLLTARCKLNKQRKEVMYRWLRDVGMPQHAFRYVLMLDSSDLFFQDDPFPHMEAIEHAFSTVAAVTNDKKKKSGIIIIPPEVTYFAEVDWAFRGGFAYNAKWAEVAFGEKFLHYMLTETLQPAATWRLLEPADAVDVRDEAAVPIRGRNETDLALPFPTACGGIYGGSAIAIMDFLKLLYSAMSVKPDKTDCFNDQGMMNGLLAGGFAAAHFPHQVVVTNPDTSRFTHRLRRGTVQWDESGQYLVNCRGERFAVVHQLNRFEDLWQEVQGRESLEEY